MPRAEKLEQLFHETVQRQLSGETEAAEAGYRQILRSAPKNVASLMNLGVLLKDRRAYKEAEKPLRQAVALAGSGAITAEALGVAATPENVPSFREAKRAFETSYVEALLRRCRGNISQAARLAKKDRKDFYDVMKKYGIQPEAFRKQQAG